MLTRRQFLRSTVAVAATAAVPAIAALAAPPKPPVMIAGVDPAGDASEIAVMRVGRWEGFRWVEVVNWPEFA